MVSASSVLFHLHAFVYRLFYFDQLGGSETTFPHYLGHLDAIEYEGRS